MRAALVALAVLLAAPAQAQTPPNPDPDPATGDSLVHVRYACEGGATLEAVFVNTASGSSFAIVGTDAGLIPMQVAVSASGARYLSADETQQLWTRGDQADLVRLDGDAEAPLRSGCIAHD